MKMPQYRTNSALNGALHIFRRLLLFPLSVGLRL